MAKIYNIQGLIQNQGNTNGYTRIISSGKTTSGAFLRFTISASNPVIYLNITNYIATTQTNAHDFDSSVKRWLGLYIDTSGNGTLTWNVAWSSGNPTAMGFTLATRQIDLWVMDPSVGGFPLNYSITSEIFCNRWDYVTVSSI